MRWDPDLAEYRDLMMNRGLTHDEACRALWNADEAERLAAVRLFDSEQAHPDQEESYDNPF